jgi:hypothetical protein
LITVLSNINGVTIITQAKATKEFEIELLGVNKSEPFHVTMAALARKW